MNKIALLVAQPFLQLNDISIFLPGHTASKFLLTPWLSFTFPPGRLPSSTDSVRVTSTVITYTDFSAVFTTQPLQKNCNEDGTVSLLNIGYLLP